MIATVFHVYSIINHSLSITNTNIIKIKRRKKILLTSRMQLLYLFKVVFTNFLSVENSQLSTIRFLFN